jgi:hypothetical protein
MSVSHKNANSFVRKYNKIMSIKGYSNLNIIEKNKMIEKRLIEIKHEDLDKLKSEWKSMKGRQTSPPPPKNKPKLKKYKKVDFVKLEEAKPSQKAVAKKINMKKSVDKPVDKPVDKSSVKLTSQKKNSIKKIFQDKGIIVQKITKAFDVYKNATNKSILNIPALYNTKYDDNVPKSIKIYNNLPQNIKDVLTLRISGPTEDTQKRYPNIKFTIVQDSRLDFMEYLYNP